MLELHAHPASTYSRRVRIALHEKQIEDVPHTVAPERGEHRKPAFLALDLDGCVPVLVDGDFVLCESAAILHDVEAIHPSPALLPSSVQARAQVGTGIHGSERRTLAFPS